MSDTIKVTISGRLRPSEYSFTEVSEQSFEVSADRGHGIIVVAFDASLRSVMDQMQSEKVHRDATARLAAAVNAIPVAAGPDPEVDEEPEP